MLFEIYKICKIYKNGLMILMEWYFTLTVEYYLITYNWPSYHLWN